MQNYDYEIKMKKITGLKPVGGVLLLFWDAFVLSFCSWASEELYMEMCEKKHIFVTGFPDGREDNEIK
ncbi:MAG TPA: hypothetical protein H9834_08340 [Candidatus Barnesiella excrementavium]|nr:hypothetical protein [Candidatus Barnesiella excrementavium]